MASKFVWGENNPFQDFLVKAMMLGVNVASKESRLDINNAFTYILQNYLENENDIAYLDYNIIEKDNYIKVIGNNSITALWLSGIIPNDIDLILEYNELNIGNRKYQYNTDTKRLTYKIMKN